MSRPPFLWLSPSILLIRERKQKVFSTEYFEQVQAHSHAQHSKHHLSVGFRIHHSHDEVQNHESYPVHQHDSCPSRSGQRYHQLGQRHRWCIQTIHRARGLIKWLFRLTIQWKTWWYLCRCPGLNQYQRFVGLLPIPSTPVLCYGTMVGPLADLMRAWHVWLNNQDFSSLISPEFVLNEWYPWHPVRTTGVTLCSVWNSSLSL